MKTFCLLVTSLLLSTPHWTAQTSGVTVRLRGVSAVSTTVAWASGAGSTVLRTTNAGATWQKLQVTSETLDFRDIDAIDERTAFALSIGNGAASRIYKTTDAGVTWKMQFKSADDKEFLDAMSFWDAEHGLVIGDSVDGKFYILRTDDGGANWQRVPTGDLPPALENEGAFAASGTNIAVVGKRDAWIGTGAAAKARVLRTNDGGRTWKVAETPIAAGPSAGIFSIAFRDRKHGVIVGGDYRKETEATNNLAFTNDGGATWTLVKGLTGFRSVVAYVPGSKAAVIAVGPAGADYSPNNGQTWSSIAGRGYDTLSLLKNAPMGWASGAGGGLAKLDF
ncbi:MAG TPA: hypothetical protein VN643_04245 [Pyrinomonadaceae bacterium]|nr:hypothetical protein [Pyrinomonadaceae bacterium]